MSHCNAVARASACQAALWVHLYCHWDGANQEVVTLVLKDLMRDSQEAPNPSSCT